MTNTFSLLFYIRTTKTKSNGTAPIYVRITINGKRAGFSETIKYSEESINKIKTIVDEVLNEKAEKKN